MKKLYLLSLIVLLTLFIAPLNAQIQIGPKAGLNIANVVGDDANFFGMDLETRTGYAGGIFFMYQFDELFSIQPEVYYTMKGATLKINGGDLTFSFDYVEIPFLLKLIIPVEGSNIRPSIFVGPSVGFNTTAKITGEANGMSDEHDLKDDTKSTDFSLVLGGGIGFMVGTNELGFDVRYILGLQSIDDTSDNADVKNTLIAFSVYFGFSVQ